MLWAEQNEWSRKKKKKKKVICLTYQFMFSQKLHGD